MIGFMEAFDGRQQLMMGLTLCLLAIEHMMGWTASAVAAHLLDVCLVNQSGTGGVCKLTAHRKPSSEPALFQSLGFQQTGAQKHKYLPEG